MKNLAEAYEISEDRLADIEEKYRLSVSVKNEYIMNEHESVPISEPNNEHDESE